MMMLSRLVPSARNCRWMRSALAVLPRQSVVGGGGALAARLPMQSTPPLQQQERSHWTKAKKKRFARHERRTKLAAQGIALPKPPYYTPIHETPVVNAMNRQAQEEALAKQDAEFTATLSAKMAQERPSVLRYHMSGLTMSDRVRKLFDLTNGNQREVVQAQKSQGMDLFALRPGDTGSTPVQIIALTSRIQQMQTHMAKHKKDKHSQRGMEAMFVRRRKLLDYLERKNFEDYRKIVKTLGLMR